MKNREKFADETLDFACSEDTTAVNNQEEVVSCENCRLGTEKECKSTIKDWLEGEHVEPPVISKKDGIDAAISGAEKCAAEIRKVRLRERINASLKPCPFCGSRARIEERKLLDGYVRYMVKFVQCTECHSKTETRICDGYYNQHCSDEEITELWNRRVKGE